jgi:FkbM family methyltransferase
MVRAVRNRYIASRRPDRTPLAAAVALLRHRPLAPLKEFDLPGNPDLKFAAVESRLARLLYWYGERGYEAGETHWWRRLCAEAEGIVEIGANIGYYTVQGSAAAPHARYTAVEANPESSAIVQRNVELNGLTNVTVITAAVTDDTSATTVELALPDQERYVAPTGAYLTTGTEGIAGRPASRTITVPAMTADTLLADADLIKLDIEGYEARVLDSARTHITANRPTIVVEVLKQVPQLRRLLRDLVAEGYLALAIGETSLHLLTHAQLDSSEPLPRYGSRDVILIPAEHADRL